MKILLIEDNLSISKGLEYTFNELNYEIINKTNLKEASMYLIDNIPSLIILDISLPDGNGFSFYENIIKKLNIKTIILTAKDDEDDIVKGLELGANDYITKPFKTKELIARVNKVLHSDKVILKSKNITFDLNKMEVRKNNELVLLTSLELRILYLLFININKVVTRTYLLEYIYNLTGNDVNDNTITVYLKRIREKLDEDIIKTVKGIGYRIDE
ncbi:MAG TPA: response regulator transcription factor [Bacilli bacterium]|nr:response regulator transcription factor [Bacilli bacterium]